MAMVFGAVPKGYCTLRFAPLSRPNPGSRMKRHRNPGKEEPRNPQTGLEPISKSHAPATAADFVSLREARSVVGSFPISDERQSSGQNPPRPKGLRPKAAAPALHPLPVEWPIGGRGGGGVRLAGAGFGAATRLTGDFEIGSNTAAPRKARRPPMRRPGGYPLERGVGTTDRASRALLAGVF